MTLQCFDRHLRPAALIAIILLSGSLSTEANDQNVLRERIAGLSSAEQPAIDGSPIAAAHGVTKLYELRGWKPAWSDRAMMQQLYDHVLRSVEHGLNPDDFHAHHLGARLRSGARVDDPEYRADTEILYSDALARLVFTLRFGKLDPSSFDPAWNFSRRIDNDDPVKAINDVLESGQITAALEKADPDFAKYDLLRQALVTYQEIAEGGGWPTVPEDAGLKLGSTGPRVVALRERLRITADFTGPEAADPAAFDADLETAVARFQRRHGIAPGLTR